MSGGSKLWFRSLVLDVVRLQRRPQVRPPVASPAYRGVSGRGHECELCGYGFGSDTSVLAGMQNSIWNYPSCPSDASSFLLCLPQQ
jgi:hypothetical protein